MDDAELARELGPVWDHASILRMLREDSPKKPRPVDSA